MISKLKILGKGLVTVALGLFAVEFLTRTIFLFTLNAGSILNGADIPVSQLLWSPIVAFFGALTREPLGVYFATASPSIVFTPDYTAAIVCALAYLLSIGKVSMIIRGYWSNTEANA